MRTVPGKYLTYFSIYVNPAAKAENEFRHQIYKECN